MSAFTPAEIAYLRSQRLGRLATIGANGDLHVVPTGFRYNSDLDTIDIGGRYFATSKKYRDALRYGRVAFVVDDALPSGEPRFVEARGTVKGSRLGAAERATSLDPEIIRLTPTFIVSFGVNEAGIMPDEGSPRYHGRTVG